MKLLLLLLCFLPAFFPARAERPETDRVLQEVRRLGDEAFAVRQEAFLQLKTWAESYPRFLLSTLAESYSGQKDMEITIRLEELMKPLAEKLFLALPAGFIGINMDWRSMDGGTGVGILSVLNGHAAKAAGLREGDVIVSMNRERIADLDSLEAFAARVAGLPPGTLLMLEILRDGQTLQIPLELGARPEHLQGVQIAPREQQNLYEAWLRKLARQNEGFDPDFPVGHFPLE